MLSATPRSPTSPWSAFRTTRWASRCWRWSSSAGEAATPQEIIAFCRRDLAHYKCPRRVDFVDRLPREPQGKVRKHDLAERYGRAALREGDVR